MKNTLAKNNISDINPSQVSSFTIYQSKQQQINFQNFQTNYKKKTNLYCKQHWESQNCLKFLQIKSKINNWNWENVRNWVENWKIYAMEKMMGDLCREDLIGRDPDCDVWEECEDLSEICSL